MDNKSIMMGLTKEIKKRAEMITLKEKELSDREERLNYREENLIKRERIIHGKSSS
jgi:uncharacterized protein (DUF3084 family)